MNRSFASARTVCALIVVATLLAACGDGEGQASFDIQGDEAIMAGVIDESTPAAVEDLLNDHPGVTTIVMIDVPGSDNDEANLEAASMIRRAGLATHVPVDGFTASGGVDFFLAGEQRTFDPGAQFGVHSWASGNGINGDELPRDDPAHHLYLEYYDAIDIDEEFYWFTLQAAPPDDFHIMTADELDQYGFATAP